MPKLRLLNPINLVLIDEYSNAAMIGSNNKAMDLKFAGFRIL